jgi:hypothetical protein
LPIKKGAAGNSIPSKLPACMFSGKPIIACVDEGSDTANAVISSGCGWALLPENLELLIEIMKRALQIFVIQLVPVYRKINHYKRVTRQNGFVGLASNAFKN